MDRRLITLLVLLVVAPLIHAEITNVSQCINVELRRSVLNNINPTNSSTHQTAYLGFIRGMISGDYRTYLFHLTDSVRIEECGTADLHALTPQMMSEFQCFTQSMGYTNHMIKTYCETSTSGVWYVSSLLQSQNGRRIDVSQLDIQFVNTNGEWRVSRWEVDE